MLRDTSQLHHLRASMIERFTRIATMPEAERTFPIGPESARRLGYDASEMDSLPSGVTESFCGVGNPFVGVMIDGYH